jgi:hypothetical protein
MKLPLIAALILITMPFVPSINLQAVAQEQKAEAPLTNNDVLELLMAGISTEIIVAKIKASKCNFDTSPETLQKLKIAGVPNEVMMAMIQASPSKPTIIENRPREAGEVSIGYGGVDELKGVKSVYIYTGSDLDARKNIINEIAEKLPGLKLAPDLESSDAVLIYGSGSEVILTGARTIVQKGSTTTNTTVYPGANTARTTIGPLTDTATTTPLYRRISYGAGNVLKVIGDGKYRLLMAFGDTRSTVFERRPSTNFAREFIKAYRKANGL